MNLFSEAGLDLNYDHMQKKLLPVKYNERYKHHQQMMMMEYCSI
jgi:hypothetical protein